MDAGEGHLVAAVTAGQVFPVVGLAPEIPRELRNGDIVLPPEEGRIGKRPDIFPLRKLSEHPLHLSAVGTQCQHSPLCGRLCRGIDLGLILREVPGNMRAGSEGMRRVGHSSVRQHAQALFFQAELSTQETSADVFSYFIIGKDVFYYGPCFDLLAMT